MSTNDLNIETLLRAHAPHAPEHLRARVLALQPAAGPRFALPSRRLSLLVIPAAAAVALLAAAVNGAFHSSPLPARQSVAAGTVTTADSAKDFSSGASGAIRKAAAPSIASTRLAHTDASLELRVDDSDALSEATKRATQIATSLGGYAKSVNYDASSVAGQGRSVIELRIPAQNVKTALARLAGLGTIVSQQLSVTDLQDRFATESAQIAQLRRRVAALATALRSPTLEEAQRG